MPSIPLSIALVAFGCIPSFAWLVFYLRRDIHPEPKYLVAKTFLMGIIISPLAIEFQLLFVQLVSQLKLEVISSKGPGFFLWAAFVEEMVKFYAVKFIALRNSEFDEPVDAMIYMIAAGLGFAAMENILVLFRTLQEGFGLHGALGIWVLRFAGATLLHALSSALLGYFLAMSWFFQNHKKKLLIVGTAIATLFHFTFNIFMSNSQNELLALIQSTILLLIMAFLVSVLFDKIQERHRQRTTSV